MITLAITAALATPVDLVVRGPGAPDEAEVAALLAARGVSVGDDAPTRAVVRCRDACRVAIVGPVHARTAIPVADPPTLARAVALGVSTALDDAAPRSTVPITAGIGAETSDVPRVAFSVDAHARRGVFDVALGPHASLLTAPIRDLSTTRPRGRQGTLLGAELNVCARIGDTFAVQPGAFARVGATRPIYTGLEGEGLGFWRVAPELGPTLAVESPDGLALTAALVVPAYTAYTRDRNTGFDVDPVVEVGVRAEFR